MALGCNSLQDSNKGRDTYVMVVTPHCEHTEQVDTQADRADQEQLVCVHLWGVQPVWMVSSDKIENERSLTIVGLLQKR